MNKKEFLELARRFSRERLANDYPLERFALKREAQAIALRSREGFRIPEDKETPLTGFYCMWETGGMQGGNCWGSEAKAYVVEGREPEVGTLDAFLLEHFPSMSFIAYKTLLSKREHFTHFQYEYYGNGTYYAGHRIDFETVWDALRMAELVSE